MAAVVAGDFELLNQLPKLRGHLCQLLGGLLGFCHTGRSIIRCLRDTGDVVCNLSGSLGCLRHVAGHLVRRGALLLDRGGDNARDVIDLVDHATDASDCLDGSFCVLLNRGYLLAYIFRSFRRLLGQFLDFVCYDRKPFASFAGAGSFDGCVQRQQVRLLRDGRDDLNDFADFRAGLTQFADSCVGGLGGFYCFTGYTSSLASVLRILING